jgi:hypothetical protein
MAMMKKAKTGVSLRSGQLKRIGRLEAKNPDRATNVASRMVERDTRKERGQDFITKNLDKLMPKRAKSGGSFPDLNKDGKITKADILKGRGVIAQKGATVKKPLSPAPKKKGAMDAVKAVGKYVSTFGGATERDNPKQKDINIVKKIKETGTAVKNKLGLKSGGSVKKMQYGGDVASMVPSMKKGGKAKKAGMHKMPDGSMMKNSMMKSGGKMGKCKYGCN